MNTHSAKRTKLTVALTAVLLLLIGVIGWMEFGNKPANTPINTDARHIVIKRVGDKDIVLALRDDGWVMTAPYSLKANAQRIDPLLSLGSAKFDGYDKSEVDLPATGLNNPGASLMIGQRKFRFGGIDADDERRYTLVDDKVSFVPSWVWSLMHGGVTAFADLTIFDKLPDELYLVSETEVRKLSNSEQLQALQADRIAAWPYKTALSADENAESVSWRLSTSAQPTSKSTVATLLRFDDRTLINTQPGFAFVISNARLGALAIP